MTRISVGGCWFDKDKAEQFAEGQDHDGRNYISRATGSQWEHETLYRTAKGRWVLRQSSDWQGSRETWGEIDAATAAEWLVTNGHDAAADRYFPKEVAAAEM